MTIDQFYCDDEEVNSVYPGENVKAKLKAVEEEDISPGFVLCDANNPVNVGKIFDAQVIILIFNIGDALQEKVSWGGKIF